MMHLVLLLFLLQLISTPLDLLSSDAKKAGWRMSTAQGDERSKLLIRASNRQHLANFLLANIDEKEFIEKSRLIDSELKTVLVTPQFIGPAGSGNRMDDRELMYPIEWGILNKMPTSLLTYLLQKKTPVDGFSDYNPLKHVLFCIVNKCCKVGKCHDYGTQQKLENSVQNDLKLYHSYLTILIEHGANVHKQFPEHNGFGEDPDKDLGNCNAWTYLPKAFEKLKKTVQNKPGEFVLLEESYNQTAQLLNDEVERRKRCILEQQKPTVPTKIIQPWHQSTFVKATIGLGVLTALFFASQWLYPKFIVPLKPLPNGLTS